MKRIFDFSLSFCALILLVIPMLAIAVTIKCTSAGPVLYWSNRVGKHNQIFKMPKFRTMRTNTPVVATHLLGDPDRYVTKLGKILRKTSLDELPQLISIFTGDMSFVGPRPALFNQDDLIELRTKKGIHHLTPGLTGWAQINGRDQSTIPAKVEFDYYYLLNQSLLLDLNILLRTAHKIFLKEDITH
jgi:O-antigen biosynthesis protein WbqP